jgi:hypothetical protein
VHRTANWCIGGCWFTLAQWMVDWTDGCLCPLPHLLYPLWIDWPRHLFRQLHNWIRTFVVTRKSDAWLGPIIFLLQTRENISLVASTTALASKLSILVGVPGAGPGCFCHNHTTQQHVNKYKNSR